MANKIPVKNVTPNERAVGKIKSSSLFSPDRIFPKAVSGYFGNLRSAAVILFLSGYFIAPWYPGMGVRPYYSICQRANFMFSAIRSGLRIFSSWPSSLFQQHSGCFLLPLMPAESGVVMAALKQYGLKFSYG